MKIVCSDRVREKCGGLSLREFCLNLKLRTHVTKIKRLCLKFFFGFSYSAYPTSICSPNPYFSSSLPVRCRADNGRLFPNTPFSPSSQFPAKASHSSPAQRLSLLKRRQIRWGGAWGGASRHRSWNGTDNDPLWKVGQGLSAFLCLTVCADYYTASCMFIMATF